MAARCPQQFSIDVLVAAAVGAPTTASQDATAARDPDHRLLFQAPRSIVGRGDSRVAPKLVTMTGPSPQAQLPKHYDRLLLVLPFKHPSEFLE
jgi:hypothetical protein